MTIITNIVPSDATPSFDPAALDAAYRACGIDLIAQVSPSHPPTLIFQNIGDRVPPEHRRLTDAQRAMLIDYLEENRRTMLFLGPTEKEREAESRLIRLMCDAMRGNKGKKFYVATETNVATFVIPDHLYERERQAAYPVWRAREKKQNVVGFGVVKQYI